MKRLVTNPSDPSDFFLLLLFLFITNTVKNNHGWKEGNYYSSKQSRLYRLMRSMIIPLREALELEISIRQGLWRHAVDKAFIKMSYFKRQSPISRKRLALKAQCSTRTKFKCGGTISSRDAKRK